MLTVAYGEAILDRSNVYRWYKMFSEGREEMNDEECSGRPSTSTKDEKINEVEKMILANRRITVREVAEDLNISIGSCHSIFINDLGMRRVAAKFVPKLLNCDQKQHRMNIANEMLDSVRDDPNLLQRVITGDEAWVDERFKEGREESADNERSVRPSISTTPEKVDKVLELVREDRRITVKEVAEEAGIPFGSTQSIMKDILGVRDSTPFSRLREAIKQKQPELWRSRSWILHHDNAPAHTALKILKFLQDHSTSVFPPTPLQSRFGYLRLLSFWKAQKKLKERQLPGEPSSLVWTSVERFYSRPVLEILSEGTLRPGARPVLNALGTSGRLAAELGGPAQGRLRRSPRGSEDSFLVRARRQEPAVSATPGCGPAKSSRWRHHSMSLESGRARMRSESHETRLVPHTKRATVPAARQWTRLLAARARPTSDRPRVKRDHLAMARSSSPIRWDALGSDGFHGGDQAVIYRNNGHQVDASQFDKSDVANEHTKWKLTREALMLTAYGDAVMSRRRVFEWHKRFKEGREESADNERSVRPSISTTPEKVDKVFELVREDRQITLNAVLVIKDLTFDQKNARKETASLNFEATTDDPELLKKVITGDETWIYGFDSETTQQASEWRFKNEPRPKKAWKAPSKVKVMLTAFFEYQGIVHHEFQQQGSTITADSYLGVLRRLREAIKQKRPEMWRSKSWILNNDNAPAHTVLKISKSLQDHSTSVFTPTPLQSRFGPLRLLPFWKAQKKLTGRKFQSIEEIKVESKKAMKAIPKTDYQICFAN
ncbi:hypothetical protein LAZ67_22000858 [Cordylochernes scorpioides]|uniref:Transposase n=1 Tax=Cordylochernes scorpioides TaxID=51811 RepID=A0ABY6LST9_9ARAC|nr:hypothetical protein LAZ67_22000858 [Cordylochernes scorpioides]